MIKVTVDKNCSSIKSKISYDERFTANKLVQIH